MVFRKVNKKGKYLVKEKKIDQNLSKISDHFLKTFRQKKNPFFQITEKKSKSMKIIIRLSSKQLTKFTLLTNSF